MLTRLEVDGFKNLFNLHVDLGPFTCIAGANELGSPTYSTPFNS